MIESFFSSPKRALSEKIIFENRTVARLVVFEFIEALCNRQRRHPSPEHLTPLEFERQAGDAWLQLRTIGVCPLPGKAASKLSRLLDQYTLSSSDSTNQHLTTATAGTVR